MNAVCSACGCSSEPRPSSVVMPRFCAPLTGMLQERTAVPSMITVQTPHWPSPQPNRGPCNSRSSRKTYKSGVVGSVSTTRVWLFTRSEIRAMRVSFLHSSSLTLTLRRNIDTRWDVPSNRSALAYTGWSEAAKKFADVPRTASRSERARKLLAIRQDNLVQMHDGLAILGQIAGGGDFVARLQRISPPTRSEE